MGLINNYIFIISYGLYLERLSIHPDREIVRTYRQSDGISTRLDIPNTLTCQSSATNDSNRYSPPRPRYMKYFSGTA